MFGTIEGLQKRAYSLEEISVETSLSTQFLRLEEKRGNLKVTRFGRRTLVLAKDLDSYLEEGSSGKKQSASAA